MTQDELVQAILACKHRGNIPHPNHPNKRMVGWIVDENVAGLSDGLFAVEAIERLAVKASSAMDRDIANDQIITLARELGVVTEQLKAAERECRKLRKEVRRTSTLVPQDRETP